MISIYSNGLTYFVPFSSFQERKVNVFHLSVEFHTLATLLNVIRQLLLNTNHSDTKLPMKIRDGNLIETFQRDSIQTLSKNKM